MEFFFSDNIIDNIITLDSQESKHCSKVLRKNIGDNIHVVDGKGTLYSGKIVLITKKKCEISIITTQKNYNNKKYYIHIAISPIKNHDRLEFFVEKSIEIGVDEISFIQCERTLRKKVKLERIRKIAVTAMKQTLKAKLPKINDVQLFGSFIDKCSNKSKFICHLENEKRKNLFSYKETIIKAKNNCILIGPEGDFSPLERELILSVPKVTPFTMSKNILRSDTAVISAISLVNFINN